MCLPTRIVWKKLKKKRFPNNLPRAEGMPDTAIIGVDGPDQKILDMKGALELINAEEPFQVALLALSEYLDDPAYTEDQLKTFLKHMRNISAHFIQLDPGAKRMFYNERGRESLRDDAELLSRSLKQRVFFVMSYKDTLGAKLSNEKLAATLQKEIPVKASGVDSYSKGFVDSAVTMMEVCYSNPVCDKWLHEFDQLDGPQNSPLASAFSLQSAIDRLGMEMRPKVGQVMAKLYDMYRMKHVTKSDFTQSKIKDAKNSVVELAKLQLELEDLLEETVRSQQLPKDETAILIRLLTPSEFRKTCGSYRPWRDDSEGGIGVDMTWMSDFSRRGSLMFDIIKLLLHSDQEYNLMRKAIKNSKFAADLCEYPSIKKLFDDMSAASHVKTSVLSQVENIAGYSPGKAGGSAAVLSPRKAEAIELPNHLKECATLNKFTVAAATYWWQEADQEWRKFGKVIARPATATALTDEIKSSKVVTSGSSGMTMVHYNVAQAKQASTRPDFRTAPLNSKNYNRDCRAVVDGLAEANRQTKTDGSANILPPGCMAFILDGGREGNSHKFKAPFIQGTRDEKLKKKDSDSENDDEDAPGAADAESSDDANSLPKLHVGKLRICWSQASLEERRKKATGSTLGLRQGHAGHVFTTQALKLPERKRPAPFIGSNVGDHIYDVDLPSFPGPHELMLTPFMKAKAWSVSTKKGSDEADVIEPAAPHPAVADEPMSHHCYTFDLTNCLCVNFCVKKVIDLTAVDGKFGLWAIKTGNSFLLVAVNEFHKQLIEKHLTRQTLRLMSDNGNHVTNYRLQQALKSGLSLAPVDDDDGENDEDGGVATGQPEAPSRKGRGRGRGGRGRGRGKNSVSGNDDKNEEKPEDKTKRSGAEANAGTPQPVGKKKAAGAAGEPVRKKQKKDGSHDGDSDDGFGGAEGEDDWDPLEDFVDGAEEDE